MKIKYCLRATRVCRSPFAGGPFYFGYSLRRKAKSLNTCHASSRSGRKFLQAEAAGRHQHGLCAGVQASVFMSSLPGIALMQEGLSFIDG
jgi:hypothetical protein